MSFAPLPPDDDLDGRSIFDLESERVQLEERSKLSDDERARLEALRDEIMRCQ